MAVAPPLAELLRRNRIPYVTFRHPPAYTAQEEAALSHTRGRCWAKVVICIADERPVQAVVPAHYSVDFDALRRLAGTRSLRLAREAEFAGFYPDCELGAMPPFGSVYGHRVFVDRSLVGEPEMVFNGGTHTDAIQMHYGDFAEIAQPTVGAIGRPPTRHEGAVRPPNPQRH
jgi:Ala-tRNA(Pro) deacylase